MTERIKKIVTIVQQWDEKLFNFRGSAGNDYRGSSYILFVPAIGGIILGILMVTYSGESDVITQARILKQTVLCICLINEVLHLPKVFALPGFFRKFLYPFYVLGISIAGIFLTIQIISLILVIFAGLAMIRMMLSTEANFSSGSSTPAQPISTPSGSSSSENKPRTATIDDGSAFGQKLTEVSHGTWRGENGDEYTQAWGGDGFVKK